MENTRKSAKADSDPAEPADLFRALEFAHYAGRFRDKVFVIAFTVLWAWYALRVVAIARAYPDMPEEGPPG